MNNWRQSVPGCFGNSDLIFAGHPLDEDRAFKWLADLRTHKVGWGEASAQLEAFLTSKQAGVDHMANQIAKAERFLKPWLLD